MKNREIEIWSIEDHSCRTCGGRILHREGGPDIATGGGNPIFRCADCGARSSDTGPHCLCWCGFSHRGNDFTNAYQCLPFTILEEHPEYRNAFLACGCDPNNKKTQVGIVLTERLR